MPQEFTRAEVTLANWRVAPWSRWSFQNVGEIVPSATVTQPSGGHVPRPEAPDSVMVDDPASGERISASDYLRRTSTDCFVALKDGKPAASWAAAHADFDAPHVVFSISKSVTGMLAGIAHDEGLLDPGAPVSHYVEMPATCGYADARLRDLLDMTVAIDFDEEYLDADGAFDRYRRAMLWNPERPGHKAETMEGVLTSLARTQRPHGERFLYASPNTDMLGLAIERATGIRYHQYMADRLWRPMGAQGAAYVTVDRAGTARAAGGVCVTVSDLARLGQLVLDDGRTDSGQVIPAGWIADMRRNGNREAWRTGNFADTFANGRYRSCWYSTGDDHDSFCGIGIHGQWVWADPATGVVIARTASRAEPSDDAATARDIAVLGQIARRL